MQCPFADYDIEYPKTQNFTLVFHLLFRILNAKTGLIQSIHRIWIICIQIYCMFSLQQNHLRSSHFIAWSIRDEQLYQPFSGDL